MHCVEQELKDRAALIESLEEAEVFYDAQYGEAKIVANVIFMFSQNVFLGVLLHWGLARCTCDTVTSHHKNSREQKFCCFNRHTRTSARE